MIGNGAVHRHLARVFGPGVVAGLDEHQLLSRFVDRADEAAFEALLARHGPMVLGVCRRALADPHDAEDAFQAVFLILVKKARTVKHRDALGPWLHGVARRVACRAARSAANRRRREQPGPAAEHAEAPTVDPAADIHRAEARAAIDEALATLPSRFRAPMVLCYLEGLTHPEAADRLNIPVGTVRSRLAWARGRMKTKLARRGLVAPAAALLAETVADAAVPPSLLQTTLRAALSIASGPGATTGLASAAAVSLMKGVLTTMMLDKMKVVFAGVLVLGGGAAVGRQFGRGQGQAGGGGAPFSGGGVGGPSRGLFGGGQPLGRPGSSMPGPLTTRADATGTDIEIQQAEAEVGRVTAALESSKARLARLKRLKELGTARKPAADKAVEQPPGQIPKKAEAAAIEMQSEERGNLVIGFDRDRGRVRIVDLVKQSSRSYQASGSTKVVPVLGIGDTVLSLLLEGPEITEVAVYKASRGRWDIQKLSIPIRGKVTPMFGFNNTSAVALMIEAPEITEIAAYSYAKERWAIQKLRESIDGTVLPQVFEGMAIYSMGRLVYAFSDITGTWDVLEMRDKSPAAIHQTNAHDRVSPRYTLLQGDFLHSFDLNSGKWSTTSLEEKK